MPVTYTEPSTVVDFHEQGLPSPSPRERMERDRFQATRILLCPWADRITLAEAIMGAYSVTLASGRKFVVGDKYPWRDFVYAQRISSIQPAGGKSGDDSGSSGGQPKIDWSQWAELTVEYDTQAFNPDGTGSSSASGQEVFQLAQESIRPSTEFITLPNKKLFWDSNQEDPIEDPEAPGRVVRMMEWELRFRERDAIPSSVADLAGKVNSTSVISNTLGITFAAETLLYGDPDVTHTLLSDGTDEYDVALRFVHRPGGWNKFYRSGFDSPQTIYDDTGAEFKPYETGDFIGGFDL